MLQSGHHRSGRPILHARGQWQIIWGYSLGGFLSWRVSHHTWKTEVHRAGDKGDRWGGGGWQWATRARWVAHRGKEKMAFRSHGVGVGVGVPWEGQPANGWRKKRDTEGDQGCTQVFTGGGGGIIRNWLLCCAGRERGTRLKRRRGVGTPGVTDEAKLAKQHQSHPDTQHSHTTWTTVPTEFHGSST